MGRNESYNFSDRASSYKGKIAFGLSIFSLCIQVGLLYKAVLRPSTIMDGLIGIYGLIMAVIAFGFMIGSFREEGLHSLYQVVTTIITSLVLVLNLFVFFLGI